MKSSPKSTEAVFQLIKKHHPIRTELDRLALEHFGFSEATVSRALRVLRSTKRVSDREIFPVSMK